MEETTSYYHLNLAFEIDNIFQMCKLKSLYSASGVSTDSGATQEAAYAMTDNERDIFDIILKSAASEVYDVLSQDTKLSDDPIRYNVIDPATNRAMIYYELYVHGEWDDKQVFGVHTAVETTLVEYCLKEWYKLRGAQTLFNIADSTYTTAITGVKNLLNRRKIPAKLVYRYIG